MVSSVRAAVQISEVTEDLRDRKGAAVEISVAEDLRDRKGGVTAIS
jgi:hypothetical protein